MRVHVVVVTDDRPGMAELMAPALGISPEAALASPHALAGTPRRSPTTSWPAATAGASLPRRHVDALDALAPVVARLAGN